MTVARARFPAVALVALALASCEQKVEHKTDEVIVVFNAGTLARPLRAALDTFTEGAIQIRQESGGSVDIARRLTDQRQIPDIIALSDFRVFRELLMPADVTWYAQFARNRIVLLYNPTSRFAAGLDSMNWWRILQRPGVRTGRSDPAHDPGGYRVLFVVQLAELAYHQKGLSKRLFGDADDVVLPNDYEVRAKLKAGLIDYAWSYESYAIAGKIPYVLLPREIDLSDPALAAFYERATIEVASADHGTMLVLHADPIISAFAIPRAAPHRALAERFAAFLLSEQGRRIMSKEHLEMMTTPVLVGDSIPTALVAR